MANQNKYQQAIQAATDEANQKVPQEIQAATEAANQKAQREIQAAIGVQLRAAVTAGELDQMEEYLTEANLRLADNDGWNSFHRAFASGHADQIPEALKTQENLRLENNDGWNSFHFAFTYGHGDQMPEALKTEENLRLADNNGRNSFHLAFADGHGDQIPEALKTQENLRLESNGGWNSFHFAFKYGHGDQIPVELLTEENLTLKTKDGETLMDMIQSNKKSREYFEKLQREGRLPVARKPAAPAEPTKEQKAEAIKEALGQKGLDPIVKGVLEKALSECTKPQEDLPGKR
jgi:ankyrin repeat protein